MLNNQEISAPVLIEDLGMQFATEKSKAKRHYGLYRCSCSKEFRVIMGDINNGKTKSCGCYNRRIAKESHTKHGMVKHVIYKAWRNMINRCTNKNSEHYSYYGGRGITVCIRWLSSFENFRDDMFPIWEEGLTIDRINSNLNYEPSNCRWANKTTQARNTRKIRTTNTSGHRGIYFRNHIKKWAAGISINSKNKYLGCFDTAIEAAQAYDNYVTLHNLEHTKNFS